MTKMCAFWISQNRPIHYIGVLQTLITVADPGFPVGGRRPRKGGALTPEAVTFRKLCMFETKETGRLGWARQ